MSALIHHVLSFGTNQRQHSYHRSTHTWTSTAGTAQPNWKHVTYASIFVVPRALGVTYTYDKRTSMTEGFTNLQQS